MQINPTTQVLFKSSLTSEYLAEELEYRKIRVLKQTDKMAVIENPENHPVYWADSVWSDCRSYAFKSISEAVKQVLTLKKQQLVKKIIFSSVLHHRRTQLIASDLKLFSLGEIDFNYHFYEPDNMLGFFLMDENTLICSSRITPWQNICNFKFPENKKAPSRAFNKLWEGYSFYKKIENPAVTALDFGSSPGGWTWVLAQQLKRTIAVDKAPLDPSLKGPSFFAIESIKQDAFTIDPREFIKKYDSREFPIDWLLSDMICYPDKLYDFVLNWQENSNIRNYIFTLKFKGKTDFKVIDKYRKIPGIEIAHLRSNKHELTCFI